MKINVTKLWNVIVKNTNWGGGGDCFSTIFTFMKYSIKETYNFHLIIMKNEWLLFWTNNRHL